MRQSQAIINASVEAYMPKGARVTYRRYDPRVEKAEKLFSL
jgi:hypothetical protein